MRPIYPATWMTRRTAAAQRGGKTMAKRVDVLPDYAVGDVVSAIRVLIRFGGIAEAEADHTRLAEASRQLIRSRWWAEVSQDTMLAALPELIVEAHRIEADDVGE